MPSLVVLRPAARARASPSEAGSRPTIQTGLSHSLRNALTNKSVPMLPDPMSTQLIFFIVTLSLDEICHEPTQPTHGEFHPVARHNGDEGH